jgi:hypothetical protein
MADIDEILKPEESGDGQRPKKADETKRRLSNLKEMLSADPVQLNTELLNASGGDFPVSMQAKYIDYVDERKSHNQFAEQVITNIIDTYIKIELSPRMKDLKQKDIIKYARLLLIVQIAEENLIKIQESIDGGDLSKDMFDSVNKAQDTLRNNMEAEEKHLDKCEKYWATYSANYGLENEEEKVIQESGIKDDVGPKHIIMDMTKLTEAIQENMRKEREKEQAAKDIEDNVREKADGGNKKSQD